MTSRVLFVTLTAIVFGCAAPAVAQSTSELWGESGEKWTPASRLPDFSYAGYRSGDAPIPDVKVTANVKYSGAKGDGTTDDAEPIQAAIDKADEGAIEVPAGRYVLGSMVNIPRSGLVLRGAGSGNTVFVVPRSLEQVRGAEGGGKMSRYSFSDAFVMVKGAQEGKK